jgi:hypothetical protein
MWETAEPAAIASTITNLSIVISGTANATSGITEIMRRCRQGGRQLARRPSPSCWAAQSRDLVARDRHLDRRDDVARGGTRIPVPNRNDQHTAVALSARRQTTKTTTAGERA